MHASAVEAAGMRSLSEGQKVSFDVQPDPKGSKAVNLKGRLKPLLKEGGWRAISAAFFFCLSRR